MNTARCPTSFVAANCVCVFTYYTRNYTRQKESVPFFFSFWNRDRYITRKVTEKNKPWIFSPYLPGSNGMFCLKVYKYLLLQKTFLMDLDSTSVFMFPFVLRFETVASASRRIIQNISEIWFHVGLHVFKIHFHFLFFVFSTF